MNPNTPKHPVWMASIYPMIGTKSGFTRFFYHPPANHLIQLYIAANMLQKAVQRENDRYSMIVRTIEDFEGDVPHACPTTYNCSWAFKCMTPRQIIKECLSEKSEALPDKEANFEKTPDNGEDENEDFWEDLIDSKCRYWSDESPELLKIKEDNNVYAFMETVFSDSENDDK